MRDTDSDNPVDGEAPVNEPAAGADGAGSDGAAAPTPATWAGRQGGGEPAADEVAEPQDGEPESQVDGPEEEHPGDEPGDEVDASGNGVPAEQETVEADTIALADREAAREAALAGLRARAAQHAAKQATGVAQATTPPPAAAPEAAPKPEEPPAAPAAPPAPAEPDEGPTRRSLWPRFVAGSLLIVAAMATATAVSLLVYLTGIARGLGGLPSVRGQLQAVDAGQPQTIVILGSDKRPQGQEIGARSDTTMLVRVASDEITVLSIPRDLKVNIPGHGIDRFNAAYTYGGPKLTLTVVKQLTGLDNINHVVNVDFNGFADAVNELGCVYVDVDHHYFHSNAGLATIDRYAEIDVPAGYQRMCGFNALQYVRYRHDDNDLVRAARQQEFLRDARQQVPWSKILGDYPQLVGILKKYVTSDIEHGTDVLSLAKLFVAARNASVVQVHFPANLGGPTASYVTASESAIRQAVAKFEGETPVPTSAPAEQSGQPSNGGSGHHKAHHKPAPPPLIDSSSLGSQYAAKLANWKAKDGKRLLDFPVYYPTKLAPDSTITSDSRAFPIDGPGDSVYHGYKMVASIPTDGYTGYYGISGTDWKDPPILANPDETKTIDGRDYLLSWDGPQLRLIGWKTDHGAYWIDNTLVQALTPGQMFAIAESMRQYTG